MVVLTDNVVVNLHKVQYYSFFLVVLNSKLARLIGFANKLLSFREEVPTGDNNARVPLLNICPKGPRCLAVSLFLSCAPLWGRKTPLWAYIVPFGRRIGYADPRYILRPACFASCYAPLWAPPG